MPDSKVIIKFEIDPESYQEVKDRILGLHAMTYSNPLLTAVLLFLLFAMGVMFGACFALFML